MVAVLLLLIAAFGQVAPESAVPRPQADPTFAARIHPLRAYDIPICSEVDGLLTRVEVAEGARVAKGDLLAAIDERHALAAVEVAQLNYEAARQRADDDIEERYASKAADVARADYESDMEANSGGRQTVSPMQVLKKKLDWERALLQIEKSQKDQLLASKDADVKQAELKANKIALERRRILAPWDGEVQELIRHQSEWVNPGDPVLHLVRYDVLQVECRVRSTDFDPAELQGRPVTVLVSLARNRQVQVPGRIVHVDQSVLQSDGYGTYTIRAEIQNQREGDLWLVRPGLPADMKIHINEPPVETTAQSASLAPQ